MSPENCNVTNLSKTLGVEKYTVSRVFTALEKDGYLNRTDSRHPRLEKLAQLRASPSYESRTVSCKTISLSICAPLAMTM